MPPHFEGKWIVADYEAGWFKVIAFDASGVNAVDVKPVFEGLAFTDMIDLKIGPDGALYVLEWQTRSLSRIEYSGTCRPIVGIAPMDRKGSRGALPRLPAGGMRSLALPTGVKGFTLFDMQGQRVWTYINGDADIPSVAELPAGLGHQVLRIHWQ